MIDGRLLNWRFSVPDPPRRLLYLPVDGESPARATVPDRRSCGLLEALEVQPYDAVAAPGLSLWSAECETDAAAMLRSLAASTAADGWLLAAFSNAWFPLRFRARGALTLGAALRCLRAEGMVDLRTYVLLPDAGCPAYWVSADRRAELDFFFSQMFIPHAPGGAGKRARLKLALLAAAGRIARVSPHRLRLLFGPAYAVVARRPAG